MTVTCRVCPRRLIRPRLPRALKYAMSEVRSRILDFLVEQASCLSLLNRPARCRPHEQPRAEPPSVTAFMKTGNKVPPTSPSLERRSALSLLRSNSHRGTMRIIVCLKPVPDLKHWHRLELDPKTKTLVRTGIPGTINPLDRHALEAALRLKEQHGGEVVVLSMAPLDAVPVIREALAMGADRAVLLSDRAFSGSDTLGTAYTLSAGAQRIGAFDLVLCGDQTVDGGTAQVSAQLAEFLGIPNVMHVSAVDVGSDGTWSVRSQIEHGYVLLEIKPPMALSVVKAVGEPRYVTLMNILEAETKEIQVWTAEDLPLTEPWVGLSGSPTQMADLCVLEKKRTAEMLSGSAREQAALLADRLHRMGFC